MGTSNCTRCFAYSSVVCNNQRAVPTISAASETYARSSQSWTSRGCTGEPGVVTTSNTRRVESTVPTRVSSVGRETSTPAGDTNNTLSTTSASSTNVFVSSSFGNQRPSGP